MSTVLNLAGEPTWIFFWADQYQIWYLFGEKSRNLRYSKDRQMPPFRPLNTPPLDPIPLSLRGKKKIFFSENPLVSSISAQVWRNISKNTKNADFWKNGPPAILAPLAPMGLKKISGVFWHLVMSNPAQKIFRITSVGQIDAWPPLWLHCGLYMNLDWWNPWETLNTPENPWGFLKNLERHQETLRTFEKSGK